MYEPGTMIRAGAPTRCPIPRSTVITGVKILDGHARYTNADTWYPSWGSDGPLYSNWADGYIPPRGVYQPFDLEDARHGSWARQLDDRMSTTAQARITGDDPRDLLIESVGEPVAGPAVPYSGRYPSANLVHDGVWYYGTYLLDDFDLEHSRTGTGYDTLGPFVGFRTSRDGGRTWDVGERSAQDPLFPEDPAVAPVRFGTPHVVDFGRNMTHSPDGKIYLVGHGSRPGADMATYLQGDHVHLARVDADPAKVNTLANWEFFAGHDEAGEPRWSRDFDDMGPVIEWDDHLGSAAATWVPELGRYVMFVTRGVKPGAYDTLVLEAPTLTGPWSLVTYLEAFGPEAYFINLPSKFLSADGRRGWLCYSANWTSRVVAAEPGQIEDPPGSTYALCFQEIGFEISDRDIAAGS